ncbi:MAG TPA: protease modulator HflC [Candidatus Glassbacteria bacterium]|nr:protease modulator HflC [Candidatus Glassbacteria bacterium]
MFKSINLIVAVLIVAVILLFNSAYRVWETEQVVVTQFGALVGIENEPGLHFKIPFVQRIRVFERRLLDYDSAPAEVLTQDKKTLYVDNYAKWIIIDPLKLLQSVQNERGAQSRLDDIIYSELRAELGRHLFHEIISEHRAIIMEEVTRKSDEKAREYGVQVLDVRIKRADLPQENERAIFSRMEAERKRIANQYRSEGEEEALKIRAETDKQAVIIMAEAEKRAQETRGEGDAQATKIYAQAYNRNPKYYEFVRTLEAYDKTIDSTTTVILTPDSHFFRYFKSSP